MRQAIANLEMEDNITDMLSPSRTQEMYNSVIAFENILAKQPEKISPYETHPILYYQRIFIPEKPPFAAKLFMARSD